MSKRLLISLSLYHLRRNIVGSEFRAVFVLSSSTPFTIRRAFRLSRLSRRGYVCTHNRDRNGCTYETSLITKATDIVASQT